MVQREVGLSQEQGLTLVTVLSCREGYVSAYCTRGRRAVLFSSAHMSNSQRYHEPVPLFLCEVLCQLCVAALVSVSVGASREASSALVLLRQERGAALVGLSVDLCVTLVSLSNQS